MSQIFLTADLHIGHTNIATHRGFGSVEEHDEFIISNWNKTVNKKDTVIIAGDLTMEKANYGFLNRLNGIKKVVSGNHDLPKHTRKLLEYVNCVGSVMVIDRFIITHIPIHESELRGKINIHGHLHEAALFGNYFNVTLQLHDYKPIPLSLIREHYSLTNWY